MIVPHICKSAGDENQKYNAPNRPEVGSAVERKHVFIE